MGTSTILKIGCFYVNRESFGFILNHQPWCIRWYGVLYLVSFIVIINLVYRKIIKYNINITKKQLMNLSEVSMISGIIGGRIWFLIDRYLYTGIPITYRSIQVWEGGMAFQGGLFLGFIAGVLWVYFNQKEQEFAHLADIITMHIPLGIMIGRLGNFLNQEFMWSVPIINIPSCLFSSITEGLISFLILSIIFNFYCRKRFFTTTAFFINDSLMRFINDMFREEVVYKIFGLELKLSQYIGILFALMSILFYLLYLRLQKKKKPVTYRSET